MWRPDWRSVMPTGRDPWPSGRWQRFVRPNAPPPRGCDGGTDSSPRLTTATRRVILRLPDRTMSFPESCADALAALQRGGVVDATGLPGLDTADGEVLIRRLLREAVVVPADQGQYAGPADG